MFDGFEIPSEKLPMRKGNGDAASNADESTGDETFAPLEARAGGMLSPERSATSTVISKQPGDLK
jgi:hypothetical protein